MERQIIEDYLEMEGQMTDALRDLLCFLSTDECVDWFVRGWFCGDEDEVRNCLESSKANDILIWYNAHC